MDKTKRLLTIVEFSDRYGVGRTSVFAEIKALRLPAVKVGRKTLISIEAAEAWAAALPAARQAA